MQWHFQPRNWLNDVSIIIKYMRSDKSFRTHIFLYSNACIIRTELFQTAGYSKILCFVNLILGLGFNIV